MIIQGSCALGSFRMQPGPTNRIDAAGALIAPIAGWAWLERVWLRGIR